MQAFYLIVYIFESIIAYMYFSDNYERKIKTPIAIMVSLGVYLLGFAVNYFDNNTLVINLVCFFLINLLFCRLSFRISTISGIFHSSILLALMFITEMIVEFAITTILQLPVDAYRDNMATLIIVGIICKVLYLIVSKLISMLFSYKKNNAVNDMKKTFLLFLYPLIITALITLLFYISAIYDLSKQINTICAFLSILSLALCCFIFVYNQILQAQENELISLKAQNEKNEINTTFYHLLEEKNEEQKVFMHDMKHHFSALMSMEDIDKSKEYIKKIQPQLNEYQYIGKTHNKMLDLILDKYSLLCRQDEIKFLVDIRSSNLSFIENSDLVSLLGNLLDNAIEAAKNCSNPQIRITTKSEKNFIILNIINSSSHLPVTNNNRLLTTKLDKSLHGFGTKSVEKTAEKYNGICQWDYDEISKEFHYNILFNKMNQD